MKLTDELKIEMYRRMLKIREFELAAMQLSARGEIPGSLHVSIGQEGAIVGTCVALRKDDYMVGTHRSHGHPIGKGATLKPLMAELLGKVTGINRGKGGSMHLSDFSVGSLGETSIVGSGLPVATGAALGSKLQGSDQVSVCFFGDGASSQGTFHESMNLASVWNLPVIYLCENNGYGELTAASKAVSVKNIATRAQGYDMPGVTVDGQDVVAVFEAVLVAVERARAGEGPSLVEAMTYRYENHSYGLPIEGYRTQEEIDEWRQRDPIVMFRARILDEKILDEDQVKAIEEEVLAEASEAVDFAKTSPYPEPSEAFTDLFTEMSTSR